VSAIVVRPAEKGDILAIAGVHVRAWRAAYRGLVHDAVLDDLTVAEREQMWNALVPSRDDAHVTIVAEIDGEVVGFCSVTAPSRDADAPEGTAEIPAIYVEPDRRRGGIGAALLDAALVALEAAGWRRVTLWVIATNAAARAFYAHYGFAPDGASQTVEALGASLDRLVREGG
jgi:ribosomal protein S18 acetylase RimI-like enzyme